MSDTFISILPGRLLVIKDPPEDRFTRDGVTILYPDVEKVYACIGRVYLHEPGGLIEEDLTGKRIVFQKWGDRTFTWKGTEVSVLREQAVLMIIEETE